MDYVLETFPAIRNQVADEINDAIIEVVERHASFIGGGMKLEDYKDE